MGCEFKARLGYVRDLRSDSVFKRKMERKKDSWLHNTVAHVATSERNPCSQIIVGLGYVICDSSRNKKWDLLLQAIGNNKVAVIA